MLFEIIQAIILVQKSFTLKIKSRENRLIEIQVNVLLLAYKSQSCRYSGFNSVLRQYIRITLLIYSAYFDSMSYFLFGFIDF